MLGPLGPRPGVGTGDGGPDKEARNREAARPGLARVLQHDLTHTKAQLTVFLATGQGMRVAIGGLGKTQESGNLFSLVATESMVILVDAVAGGHC